MSLDPDAGRLVRRRMQECGMLFRQALNELIRAGAEAPVAQWPFRTEVAHPGRCDGSLDRAPAIAGAAEDAELLNRPTTAEPG